MSPYGAKDAAPRGLSRSARSATGVLALSLIAVIVAGLLAGPADALASEQQENYEEVRPFEPVGANQLVLRSLLASPGSGRAPVRAVVTVNVPARLVPAQVRLEVRDHRDLGYFLRPPLRCGSAGPCEYTWEARTLAVLGVSHTMLWPLAQVGDPSSSGTLIPACLCNAAQSRRGSLQFIFIAARTINLSYRIFDDRLQIIDSGERRNWAAGQPVVIQARNAHDPARRYKIVVNHIAAAGGAAERFTETYYFFGFPRSP